MKSVIEEIYYGNCKNYETIELSEEYWKVNKKYGELYEKLEEGLNEEQKKLLNDLYVQSAGLEGEAACTHFKEGFKMGLLIAIEALHG